MSTLPSPDDSFQHVGLDGVVRTYHTNGTVLGYLKLKPTHIVQLLKNYHGTSDLAQNLTGVDGHDVTDERQLFNPGEALLPIEFRSPGATGGAAVVKERHNPDGELPVLSLRLSSSSDHGCRMVPLTHAYTIGAIAHPVQERGEQQSEPRSNLPIIYSPAQICYWQKCKTAQVCRAVSIFGGGHCRDCIQFGNDRSKSCSIN